MIFRINATAYGLVSGFFLIVGSLYSFDSNFGGRDARAPRAESKTVEAHSAAPPVYYSPQHIVTAPDGLLAYVVNATADSISLLDVRARRVIDEIPVGRFPVFAAVSATGRELYVSCLHDAMIQVVDLERPRVLRSIRTGYEPVGVVCLRDGKRIAVANSLVDTISIIELETGKTLTEIPVGRNPRYLAATPDGERLIVGNSFGRSASIIDLTAGRVTETRDLGRAGLLRNALCSNDGRWIFIAHVISHDELVTLQMERGFIHSNGFSILDLQQPGRRVTLLLDRLLAGAANPWGLTLSPDDQWLYVSLAGVHEIAIVNLPEALKLIEGVTGPDEITALAQDVELLDKLKIMRRVDAGGLGPRSIALSQATGELLVANYFSDQVAVLEPASGAVLAIIELGPKRELTLWRKGEFLFCNANLCFQQWFSCASCHQEDASIDGFNWDLANDGLFNPKNVKSLHDIHDTPPAMWTAVRETMDEAVAAGQRFLGFLPDPENHLALMTYLGDPPIAPNPYRQRDPEKLKRGEGIFREARCTACHPAPLYTDLRKHDLGITGKTELHSRFETPSLRECHRTAPYLHDGRAQTLEEIFTRHNPDNRHGLTGNLNLAELDALLEYVRSL